MKKLFIISVETDYEEPTKERIEEILREHEMYTEAYETNEVGVAIKNINK